MSISSATCGLTLLLGTPHSGRGNVLRKLHLSPTVLLGPKLTHTAHNRNENGIFETLSGSCQR
jgi:hypothetical protein